MSDIAAEFSTTADVRNIAIVRELDRARTRGLWWMAGSIGVIVALLLFTIWQQVRISELGYDLEQVQQAREREDHLREHLMLELDTLRSPALLAVQAARLELTPPDPASHFVIERVTSSPPPSRSVVAAR